MKDNIKQLLIDNKIINPNDVVEYYHKVRDRDDIKVLKCIRSGVIFLSANKIDDNYYKNKTQFSDFDEVKRKIGLKNTYEDDYRRFKQFNKLIKNKSYLDIGTGLGGILDWMKKCTREIAAVEPRSELRNILSKKYLIYESIDEIPPQKKFDIITLFHVFEHIPNPIVTLKKIFHLMNEGGKLIIEVPHARDALLSFYELESFKKFTFWSEHLILHTRESLSIFLRNSSFNKFNIFGFQRYPLANHLYWLAKGEPRGHNKWQEFNSKELKNAYEDILQKLDLTDTLIAVVEK